MRSLFILSTVTALFFAAAPARAEPFEQGSMRVGLGGGLGTNPYTGDRYGVVGGSFGYFVVNGLELSLGGATTIGADINAAHLRPGVTFVAFMVPTIKPYVGPVYTHYFYGDPFDDADAVGARGGLFYVSPQSRTFLGIGVLYERIVSTCDEDCTAIIPELTFSISF
ncbi:MAG: hypothetical protein KDA28_11315 [Phycisphaerales bacterium]|nr:hypothetical protein [Phycisphaerales bacterium]